MGADESRWPTSKQRTSRTFTQKPHLVVSKSESVKSSPLSIYCAHELSLNGVIKPIIMSVCERERETYIHITERAEDIALLCRDILRAKTTNGY